MQNTIHILCLDDSEDDRDFIQELLEEDSTQTWQITGAEDSNIALDLADEHHFDCVLLDYSLPGHTGIEILQRLRERNIEVPVVILTGQGNERVAVNAMKSGAQDYVAKGELTTQRLTRVITEAMYSKRAELSLLHRANFDHLTGLASRALLMDRLESAIIRSKRHDTVFALLFMDLNKFKTINDTLGHKIGDLVLKEVAKRLRLCTREGDTLSRLGGDEFVVILEDLADSEINTLNEMLPRIHHQLTAAPAQLGSQKLYISVSIGVALYPTSAAERDALLDAADQAMYQAKQTETGFYIYSGQPTA